MSLVLAFANPILDSVVKLRDNEIIRKFKLPQDGHKQTTMKEMEAIFEAIKNSNYKFDQVPGGSALNSLRMLQWLYDEEKATVVLGSVGIDKKADLLMSLIDEVNVESRFVSVEDDTTGWVISLVYGANRSLIANLGAAAKYQLLHFLNDEKNVSLFKECPNIYMEGFFITDHEEVSTYILEQCVQQKKKLIFNLNAEYLIKSHGSAVKCYVKESDIVFGNKAEYTQLGVIMGMPFDDMIKNLLESKTNKMLVITNGSHSVHAYWQNEAIKYKLPHVNAEKIVDTTGCGDSFVAGFMFGHLNNLPPLQCIKWGTWLAQHVLTQLGCMPPADLSPKDIHKVQ